MKTKYKIINKFVSTGKLILANDLTKINFGIYDNSKVTFNSITEFLDEVYNSDSPYISFTIKRLDLTNPHWITKIGKLHKAKDSDGVNDYFVNDFPLGKQLHEIGEENINMKIEHLELTEATDSNGTKQKNLA